MKKYIAGIFTGIIITAAITVSAATVKQYILTPSTAKVFVNGTVQTEQGQPVLEYNKNTYIPASMLTKSGVLTKNGNNYIFDSKPVAAVPKVTTPKKSAESYLQVINNKNYVRYVDIYKSLKDKGFQFSAINNEDIKAAKDNETIMFYYKDSFYYNGISYIDYDFFVQNIYPLL
ncbi:MAG: hypothetical protein Q8880_06375 [Bacteroidota bacterium]|nr:hypothetical protein [Bacteroidota bacterium]